MSTRIPEILEKHESAVLDDWIREQLKAGTRIREAELRQQSSEFIRLLRDATRSGDLQSIDTEHWSALKQFLASVSRQRVQQGFSTSETALFIFSFKLPLFSALRRAGLAESALADELWLATALLDRLGLYTVEVQQQVREEVIVRQQTEMMELSTPVVKLWEGVLALPLIGTLDSGRTQVVMETLLRRIVETNCRIAIIDITGVPTVDTLVAQHLLKTIAAARLMGADCIISGIRPQIAQTIVHLGVDLGTVATKASLADAFALALTRNGAVVSRGAPASTTTR